MKAVHRIAESALLGALILLAVSWAPQEQKGEYARIGVFDSRALAIAYTASIQHEHWLAGLRDEQREAREAGNQERVQEIDAEGRASQARRHKQGFSTAPVDDILKLIAADLPAIAEQAGVDAIVSKWRVAWQRPGLEFKDITALLIAPFDPNERTLATIRQLAAHEPLPLYETDWEAVERH